MLPTTPTANIRFFAEDTVQPVQPAAQIRELLSEFAPGQKLLAQIQVQLANGAYRATIAQRDVTLALPFSAKAGDSLELEVVETDGRVAFAVVPPRPGKAEPDSSANASISRAGQLISALLGSASEEIEEKAPGVVLARGQPLAERAPAKGADLAPLLEKAVAKSGLFYESHQAKWVGNRQPVEVLLDEPQATLTSPSRPPAAETGVKAPPLTTASARPAPLPVALPAVPTRPAGRENDLRPGLPEATPPAAGETQANLAAVRRAVPDEIAPLVQQQLTGLANNVYAFHGFAWPGQQIEWEIIDQDEGRRSGDDEQAPAPWKTRLHLSLPSLGSIDASLQLNGNTLAVHLTAPSAKARQTLRDAGGQLERRLADAGLQLVALQVEEQKRDEPTDPPAA